MNSLYIVLQLVIEIYGWIVIAYVVVGLLMAFGVVNVYNRAVNIIYEFLTRATEPLLRPIRRVARDAVFIEEGGDVFVVVRRFLRGRSRRQGD